MSNWDELETYNYVCDIIEKDDDFYMTCHYEGTFKLVFDHAIDYNRTTVVNKILDYFKVPDTIDLKDRIAYFKLFIKDKTNA